MAEEPGREIYRKHRERLGRHLQREDRREYSLEVLSAFIAEYTAHTHGIRFYNRGIPDGYGWEGFFGLKPTMTVLEYGPGDGWFTELLAPMLSWPTRSLNSGPQGHSVANLASSCFSARAAVHGVI